MPPAPASTPAPARKSLTLKTVLTDLTVAVGAVATVGEGILVALPAGPVHDAFAVALPLLFALVAGLRRIGG